MAVGSKNPNDATSSQYNTPGGVIYSNQLRDVDTGYNAYRGNQQSGPYRGGLQSNFDWTTNPSSDYQSGYRYGALEDSDSDVRQAANLSWEMQNPNAGSSHDDLQSRFNQVKGRIGMKNSLAEQIANNAKSEREQEDIYGLSSGQALGEGLKNTRQNYNSRGLLYSGMRQTGENQVKGAVAGQLASSVAGSKRDSSNSLTAAQNAYASVDLANQQESLQLAHQAFDTANANSIARLQAMQQLGSGVGGLAGTIAGSYRRSPASTPAAAQSQPAYSGTDSYNSFYDSPGRSI